MAVALLTAHLYLACEGIITDIFAIKMECVLQSPSFFSRVDRARSSLGASHFFWGTLKILKGLSGWGDAGYLLSDGLFLIQDMQYLENF